MPALRPLSRCPLSCGPPTRAAPPSLPEPPESSPPLAMSACAGSGTGPTAAGASGGADPDQEALLTSSSLQTLAAAGTRPAARCRGAPEADMVGSAAVTNVGGAGGTIGLAKLATRRTQHPDGDGARHGRRGRDQRLEDPDRRHDARRAAHRRAAGPRGPRRIAVRDRRRPRRATSRIGRRSPSPAARRAARTTSSRAS